MLLRSTLITLPIIAFAAGCTGGGASSNLAEARIDTLAGGIVQVTNTGPTAWADTSGWRLVEELVIAPEEGSPGELSSTYRIAADDDGNVYVMQDSPSRIAKFGPDGNWLMDIGREGDGPGEFRDGMLGIVGDTLFVQDPNNSRLSTFRTDGSYISARPSQCCWYSSRVTVLSDGHALILGPPPAGVDDRGAMYFTRMDGTVTDTMLLPPARPEESGDYWTVTRRSGQNTSMRVVSIPMRASDNAVVRPDGKVVSGRTDTYRLTIGDSYTDTTRIVVATVPALAVTDVQRDSAYRATLDDMREDWRDAFAEIAKLSDIPRSWPLWTDFAVDRDNNIWVALPGEQGGFTTLQVFNPDGVLLGNVPGVGPRLFSGFWTSDRVYFGDETEEGIPIIRVYRIDKSRR